MIEQLDDVSNKVFNEDRFSLLGLKNCHSYVCNIREAFERYETHIWYTVDLNVIQEKVYRIKQDVYCFTAFNKRAPSSWYICLARFIQCLIQKHSYKIEGETLLVCLKTDHQGRKCQRIVSLNSQVFLKLLHKSFGECQIVLKNHTKRSVTKAQTHSSIDGEVLHFCHVGHLNDELIQ